MQKKNYLYKIVSIAMLTALATVLYVVEIPLMPSFGFLKYDLSDIVALIGGIFFGPLTGVAIEFLKNVIHVMIRGAGETLGFGNLMNFIVGVLYIVPFVVSYNVISKKKSKAFAITFSAVIGCIFTVAVGAGANYIIAPLFFKYFLHQTMAKEFLMTYLASSAALNAMKSAILSAVAYPVILVLLGKLKKVSRIGE